MSGLWRNIKGNRGKYDVTRTKDGSKPDWPWFVLGARDPAAPAALMEYAAECESLGLDPEYVEDLRRLSMEFEEYRLQHGSGAPDLDEPEEYA